MTNQDHRAELTALILAGNRAGQADPLALQAGVSHKALLPVAGTPMILHVIGALQACPSIGRIVVSTERADVLPGPLQHAPGILARSAASSPSESVAAVLQEFGAPLLVTTADHALLSREILEHFIATASKDADAVAAVARSQVVLTAYPGNSRTWLLFRDGAFSGCNLFLLRTPLAARAVRFWRTVEQQRKRPLAMARLIGPAALLGYMLRLLTLQGALRMLERRIGVRLAVTEVPFADAAIDVDKPADLILVEAILAGRATA